MPAIFAITTDPFIVYTSNIFAILGLRALYFALAAVLHRFAYLKQALAVLLIFILTIARKTDVDKSDVDAARDQLRRALESYDRDGVRRERDDAAGPAPGEAR